MGRVAQCVRTVLLSVAQLVRGDSSLSVCVCVCVARTCESEKCVCVCVGTYASYRGHYSMVPSL